MSQFIVYHNYFHKRNETSTDIALDCRNDLIKSCSSKREAFDVAHKFRDSNATDNSIIYVILKTKTSERSIYYLSYDKEGLCS